MTANLTVNYTAPLPTEADLLVTAGLERVEGRKVWLHLEVRDGPASACRWPGEDGEGRGGKEREGGKEEGGGGGEGTVYAQGSALFIVLAKGD